MAGEARRNKPTSPLQAWTILFTDELIGKVLEFTNKEISDLSSNYGDTATYCKHVTEEELRALFGLLILSGVYKSAQENVKSLWASDGTDRDIFRATMPLKRFLFLLTALRFDYFEQRDLENRLSPISEIFEDFMKNCRENYSPSQLCTVDEMLVGFRGRCKFRMYIKNKPNKYGIKVMFLCDARTHHLYNAFIYAGKDVSRANPKKPNVPTLDVLELTKPIYNSNLNITGDNWFSSMQLVEELSANGLTYLGTLRVNKREIPKDSLPSADKATGSSLFGFTRDVTITYYVPKKRKAVVLSMHHDTAINGQSRKPEMIEDYNAYKVGVDCLDQKVANYSVSRRSRRWPLTIFYALNNVSTVNSHVLYQHADPSHNVVERRIFNAELGRSLVDPFIKSRLSIPQLQRELRMLISRVIPEENVPSASEDDTQLVARDRKRKRCQICPSKKDNKANIICSKCAIYVCKVHCSMLATCQNCMQLYFFYFYFIRIVF